MRIIGHGIDLMRLSRVRRHLANKNADWVDSIFTEQEKQLSDHPPHNVDFFAGRFVAKEAVAKALGTGFSDDVTWQDVEILRDSKGAPSVKLTDGARTVAESLGITNWLISISHSGGIAIASAIAIGD